MPVSRQSVLRALENELKRPVSFRELARQLGLRERDQREQLKAVLRAMARNGEVVRIKGGRFGLPRKMNLVVGILKCSPKGYGFVSPERAGVADVFVREPNMDGALHGDTVVARIEHRKQGGRLEGSVIRILERAHETLIGRFELGQGFGFVVPLESKLLTELVVPLDQSGGAKEDMIVEAEILEYPTRHRRASGRVLDVLGYPTDPGIDFELVVRRNQLPREFPQAVRNEARAVSEQLEAGDLRGRRDFREQKIFTIDGEKAQDFDDAVGVERLPDGGWRLSVHIADVSHYVQPGSELDAEALARGTSVYFPGKVIPMLPEELSNGICSLNPKVDRLTLSLVAELDREGEVRSHELTPGVIRSCERLTYTAVQQVVVDHDLELTEHYAHIIEELEAMAELARVLAARRRARGSIDFDLPESEIVLNVDGEMTGIRRSERLVSHNIIEEFMILANEVVAQDFVDADLPFVYRIHEPPAASDVDALNNTLNLLGMQVDAFSPASFREVMERVRDTPQERFANTLCLRAMRLARYQTVNLGHFGLASKAYSHFTSPIRRYPDLVVHRLVKETLLGEELKPGRREQLRESLEQVSEQCSRLERRAEEAEREYIERKKVRFMADKVGEEFDATVTGVASFGFFVELDEYFVEGLVHLTSLNDDYYEFDELHHRLLGEATGRTFGIGQRVRVKVTKVDMMRRFIDFQLVEVLAEAPQLQPEDDAQ